MAVHSYAELSAHKGHDTIVVSYGEANVAIECEECCEVLLDFDNEEDS